MGYHRKSRVNDAGFRRMLPMVLFVLCFVLVMVYLVRTNRVSQVVLWPSHENDESVVGSYKNVILNVNRTLNLPNQTELSIYLEKVNRLPPRNLDLFPKLAKGHIKIVLYVHNRPQYLQLVVDSLSKVEGIGETLLVVSHDGYFKEMNDIVERINFCQVKQIFAPYSPHIFPNSFPGVSQGDCQEKDNPQEKSCKGNADQYGNHRSPKIVSLKHHWWWMMNTVWDGLVETWDHTGHILFIEEDHFIFPNAYRNIQMLASLKRKKCSDCYAANLAPSDVNSKGEGWEMLIAEKIGNVGYAFNRTVWRKIHERAREFCFFDDYNWDITMWATVYPSWGTPVYTLRGPRRSAAHFGRCGLHQGQGKQNCMDNGGFNAGLEVADNVPNINSRWHVHVYKNQEGYKAGFKGWGGWGDERDRQLCLNFAVMYHVSDTYSS
ncbi:hypothetical protein H6P81_014820 [Aristolochia fimbriata]|uniref:Alpha-1,6-mannosyl-glycoprotein 2-beta-N-acetylglucosaminyltransferase n=1 Tax=Aristolochia fimbriata TaxID=158543 RepID=A0AAV7E3I1_ARIFI|nr:hypothetical protein H6P81_014820 [Aristolochia fimbriata]